MNVQIDKSTWMDYMLLTLLIAVSLACLAPIWYTAAISFSDRTSVTDVWLFPVGFNLNSYTKILDDAGFFHSLYISFKRVLLGGSINFLLSVLMAYPLSKSPLEFKWRNVYVWIVVFTMLFQPGLVPWYMAIQSYGLMDHIWALVLPGAVPVFNVILLMNFFRNVPKELSEAAQMDGATPIQMLIRIYVPISVPALATITLFSIVGHWNSFFDGLVLMNKSENYPLQTYIQQMVVQINAENMDSSMVQSMSEISNRTLNAAKIFVSMLPVLAIYPFLQRYFVHGITLGSVKE